MKHTGSYNGCSIASLNRIQTHSGWELPTVGSAERLAIEARFWAKVNKTAQGCWLWTASTSGSTMKHGQFNLPRHGRRQVHIYAHRMSWLLAFGPIPTHLQVCHHCDVPRCVRPDHLFLGTQDDNIQDAVSKRRFSVPHTFKLSQADRLAIFQSARVRGSGVALARHYGVTKGQISRVRRGLFVGAPLQRTTAESAIHGDS